MSRKTRIQPDVLALCLAQDYTCAYCPYRFVTARGPTFDHVWPRGLGGPRTLKNGLAACRMCNLRKSGRQPTRQELAIVTRVYPIASEFLDLICGLGGRTVRFGTRFDRIAMEAWDEVWPRDGRYRACPAPKLGGLLVLYGNQGA